MAGSVEPGGSREELIRIYFFFTYLKLKIGLKAFLILLNLHLVFYIINMIFFGDASSFTYVSPFLKMLIYI